MPTPLKPLAPGPRFLATLATFALLYLGQPGLLRKDGFGHLGFTALVPWAYFCCRPGPRAFFVEWLACSLGAVAMTLWMRHLLPWLLVPMGILPGLWLALGGVFLRRLATRHPLTLAVPAAWMLAELIRWYLPAPLSFGWWRLGLFAHDTDWLVGSTRFWGTWGLSWVLAAFSGWVASLLYLRTLAPDEPPPFPPRRIHILGVGPLILAVTLAVMPPPETEPGPLVLLVQPGIEQSLKAFTDDPLQDLYADAVDLTHEGLAAAEEPPDLVIWGETMLPFSLPRAGVVEAHNAGARTLERAGWTLTDRGLLLNEAKVSTFVLGVLFGAVDPWAEGGRGWGQALARMAESPWYGNLGKDRGVLPPGTSFMTGLVTWVLSDGAIRKQNGAALWGPGGSGPDFASKVHLVPAAEDADAVAAIPLVIDTLRRVAGYVPDFVSPDHAAVLPLESRGGRRYSVGVSVCYDNAFDDPYREPLTREDVDFFVILSNEAWYGRSVEMDHLVAMSRMRAVAVGRSVVRATNSGTSLVVDPHGELVGVIEDEQGRRKMVRGTLSMRIPVPTSGPGGAGAERTLWVRTGHLQPWLWGLICLLLVVFARPAVTPTEGGASQGQASGSGARPQV